MDFFNYILDHWSAFSSAILFIISTIYGVKKMKLSSKEYAKTVGSKLMFAFEKKAEEFLNTTDGKAKFKEVISLGYDQFPANVRLFVSKPLFEEIVQSLHDEAIKFVEKEMTPVTPIAPVVDHPVITSNTVDAQSTISTIIDGLKRLGVNISTDVTTTPTVAPAVEPQIIQP